MPKDFAGRGRAAPKQRKKNRPARRVSPKQRVLFHGPSFATGALVFAVSFNVIKILKRVGLVMMFVGLILYALVPCSVYVGKLMFEESGKAVNERLSQNLEEFKEQVYFSIHLHELGAYWY